MARRGRKRKDGLRTPSGHLSRSAAAMAQRNEIAMTQNQPHRRSVPKDMRSDQRAESVLGRLYLTGKISERECWAGEAYRSAMASFARIVASPVLPNSALSSMVAPGMETPAEADHLSNETPLTPEEKEDKAFGAFDDIMAIVGACERNGGQIKGRLFSLVDDVVMRDLLPDRVGLTKLRFVLQSLASHWNMAEIPEGEVRVSGKRTEKPSWGHDEKIIEFVREPLARA